MTKYESVLSQALELDDRERELLIIEVTQSLESPDPPIWDDPRFKQEIERRVQHAREHPETLMEWDEAEKAIFGDFEDD